jgi:hypothetical protein
MQDALESNLGAIECESGKVEVQWNNKKKCVLETMSDLDGKFERTAGKPLIAQEMISKTDEKRKWKSINNEEEAKNCRRRRKDIEESQRKDQGRIS